MVDFCQRNEDPFGERAGACIGRDRLLPREHGSGCANSWVGVRYFALRTLASGLPVVSAVLPRRRDAGAAGARHRHTLWLAYIAASDSHGLHGLPRLLRADG